MSSSLRTGWRNRIFASIQGGPHKDRSRFTLRLNLEQFEDRLLMAPLPLGAAESFAVLGGSTVTNTGSSAIIGDVGVSPGTAVTGFPPGLVTGGTIHLNDGVALQAQADLTTAYNVLAGEAFQADLTGQDLGGRTLTPGVYHFSTSAQLTGTLTLDAQGDPEARFDFQIGSTLTTASTSSVLVINGADGCNVFWQVGSSATLGTDTSFRGNILALTSITLNTRANILDGRALARNGAVTLDTNNVSNLCITAITPPVNPPITPPVDPIGTPPGTSPGNPTGTPPGTPPTNPPGTPPTNPPGTPPTNPPGTPPTDPPRTPPTDPPRTPATDPPRTPATDPPRTPAINPPGSPPINPPTGNAPPTIISLRRFGFHARRTILVLSFSTQLDASRAQDPGNFRIETLGGPGRGGSQIGRSIGVRTAVYDPSALTVTLRPTERLDIHNRYKLTVNGSTPTGLAGPSGASLGRSYVGIISRATLDGPAPSLLLEDPTPRAERTSVVAQVSAQAGDGRTAPERWIEAKRRARLQAAGL